MKIVKKFKVIEEKINNGHRLIYDVTDGYFTVMDEDAMIMLQNHYNQFIDEDWEDLLNGEEVGVVISPFEDKATAFYILIEE